MGEKTNLRVLLPALMLLAAALIAVIAAEPARVSGEVGWQMRTPTPTVIPFDDRDLSGQNAIAGRAQAIPTLTDQLCFRLIDGALPIRTRAAASARTIATLTSDSAFQADSILLADGGTWLNILITLEMASIQGWIQVDGAAFGFELCGLNGAAG
jgi:hypothetical protein